MEYIVACHDPALLVALRAFADALAQLPDPRDPRGMRHALPVLLGTLLVALAGGANSMAWWPPSRTTTRPGFACGGPWAGTPPRGTPTCGWSTGWTRRRPCRRLLILALDGKVARRSGDRADGTRTLYMVQEPCAAKSNEITAIPCLLDCLVLEGAVVMIDAAGCQRAIV